MGISLYDASVGTYQQILGAVANILEKGKVHLESQGIDPDTMVDEKLIDDMLPFKFQVVSVYHHSLGALEGVKAGQFKPPAGIPDLDYAGLQKLVADAQEGIKAFDTAMLESYEAKDVFFEIGGNKLPFTGADFLLTFSLPNFYFHASTTYDMLRIKGAPLGKRDFMGAMRMKLG